MRHTSIAAAVAAALGFVSSANVAAQSADEHSLDTVIVTGSRIAGRTVTTSEAPIDIFSGQDIDKTNKPDLLESLQTLVPALNLPSQAANGLASRVVRGAYLRGLSPGHTLVLINGKRRHATASVGAGGSDAAQPADLGLIPSSAIERIEVLRDGASAIYGSDAIAGVINIITRKDNDGLGLTVRGGEFFDGEGDNLTVKAGTGFALGDGHLYVSSEYSRRERTYRGAPAPEGMLYYFPLDANGNRILPLGSLSSPRLPAGARPDPREATRNDKLQQINGQTPYETIAVTLDAAVPLAASVETYGLLTYAYRDAESFNGFRLPLRNENVRAIFPDGYSPINDQEEHDYELTAGIRGDGEHWAWDFSSVYGRNFAQIGAHDTVNPSFGLASQTEFHIGDLDSHAWTTNYDLRRAFESSLFAKPSEFSVGAEYRRENFQISHGDYQSYAFGGQPILDGPNAGRQLDYAAGSGAQAVYGYRPEEGVDSTRNSKAVYTGISIYPTQDWLISLAGRYEDFSDFGDARIGRLSTRYELTPRVAVRATLSNAFQAPSLGTQAYKKLNNWNTWVGHTLAVNSPGARLLGSKPLTPEESENISVGVVAEILDGVNLAVDVYQIDVDDRIALSTSVRDAIYPGSAALLVAAGLPGDAGANYFINAADTRSRGIELTLDSRHDLGRFGSLRWNLSSHYNDTTITGIASTPHVLSSFNVPVFTTGQQQTLRFLSPRNKEILNLNWSLSGWTLNLRETHYGQIRRFGVPTTIATSGPYAGLREIEYDNGNLWITDLDLAYEFSEHLRINVAAGNIFDVKPGKLPEPLVGPTATYAYAENGPITSDGGAYSVGFEYRW